MSITLFCIALCTSIVGSICGIGGGVIIKPVLDAMNIMSVSAISFLSGCTVLAMSVVSVGKNLYNGQAPIHWRITPALGVGAAAGGVIGKLLFNGIRDAAGNESLVGLVQALVLTLITVLTLVYVTLEKKGRIRTRRVENLAASALIGLMLGLMSSFLGIGGGPINLAVLSFFFSMKTKEAAINSLCVILLSQIASLVQMFVTASVPNVLPLFLFAMIAGGVTGGLTGQAINKRISSAQVDKLFVVMLLAVSAISLYNAYSFASLL